MKRLKELNLSDDYLFFRVMQDEKQIYLPKRSRYYQSAMDLDVLKRGDDVSQLKKNCVIFICTFSLFDGRLHRYTFRNQSQERAGLFLEDGTEKIFLSTKGTENDISEHLLDFLDFLENSETDKRPRTALVEKLQQKVMQVKNSQDEEARYMMTELKMLDRYNRGLEQGMTSGLEQGLKQGRREIKAIIQNMLEKGMPWSEITTIAGINETEWNTLESN